MSQRSWLWLLLLLLSGKEAWLKQKREFGGEKKIGMYQEKGGHWRFRPDAKKSSSSLILQPSSVFHYPSSMTMTTTMTMMNFFPEPSRSCHFSSPLAVKATGRAWSSCLVGLVGFGGIFWFGWSVLKHFPALLQHPVFFRRILDPGLAASLRHTPFTNQHLSTTKTLPPFLQALQPFTRILSGYKQQINSLFWSHH